MRAAKMKERPSFQLMVQTDVQSIYHMQMPRWLFSDPRYCEMSLDAKVTYTFLLNRFQLSRRNGWVNERGEVFGGHLNEAYISATCEMVVTVVDGTVDRFHDGQTGLNLFRFTEPEKPEGPAEPS